MVIQDQVEEGLDNVVIIPISVIVLDENDNPPRYSIHSLSHIVVIIPISVIVLDENDKPPRYTCPSNITITHCI